MHRAPLIIIAIAAATFVTSFASGQSVSLTPTKDNTLYQPTAGEENSNGAGTAFFVGNTNGFASRRAVLSFDVAGAIPPNMVVVSATLTLNVNKSGGTPQNIELHRLTANWGEGTSNPGPGHDGAGIGATTGDATWVHSFYPGASWSTAGGDYSATVSSSAAVPSFGTVTIPSTPQFVADVQSFFKSPSTNFGWILIGDETVYGSATRFDSRESIASLRPTLTIAYVYQEPIPGDTNDDRVIDLTDLNNVLNNFGTTSFGNPGDTNGDSVVDLTDLNNVLNNFGQSYSTGALAAVPEPTSLGLLAAGAAAFVARRRRS